MSDRPVDQRPGWGGTRPKGDAPRQRPLGVRMPVQPQNQGAPQQAQVLQPQQVVLPDPIMAVNTIPPDVAQWTAEMLRVLGWNSKRGAQGALNAKNAALLQAQVNNPSPLMAELGLKQAVLAQAYAANGVWNSMQEMQAAEIRATLSFEAMPNQKPELKTGSANPTFWLKGLPDPNTGETSEFIFKPATPGSLMGGIPAGGEPIREALTGRAAEQLSAFTGLDFKMPLTNVISVDSNRLSDFQPADETKKLRNTPTQVGSLQQFSSSQGELRSHLLGKRQDVTAQSCQAIAVLDTVTLNLDRHDGNLLLDQAGTGVIPIDHGLSFPDSQAVESGMIGINMAGDKNVMLRLPNSYVPFTQASLDGIANIDPDLMQAALAAESRKMGQLHPSLEDKMSSQALSISNLAAQFLKAAAPRLPPAVLQAALGANAAELLDITATPQARALATATIIAEYLPKVAAIKEFWMMPGDAREALYQRLAADRLMSASNREKWLYQNIDAVLDYNRGSKAALPPLKPDPAVDADLARQQILKVLPNFKFPRNEAVWLLAWNGILQIGRFAHVLNASLQPGNPKFLTLGEFETWFRTYMTGLKNKDEAKNIETIKTFYPHLIIGRWGAERPNMLKAWDDIGRLGGMKAVQAKVQSQLPKPAPRDPEAALLLLLSEPDPPSAQALKALGVLDQLVTLDATVVSGPSQKTMTELGIAAGLNRRRNTIVAEVMQLTNQIAAGAVAIIARRLKALEYRVSAKDWEEAQNYLNNAYSGQVMEPLKYLLGLERSAPPNPIRT